MNKFFDAAEYDFQIRELMDLGYTLVEAQDMVDFDEITAESEYQDWLDSGEPEYDQIVDDWRSEAEYDY